MRNSKAQVGAALDQLMSDVKDHVRDAIAQARAQPEPFKSALMKQAIDTPHRARAQLAAWVVDYNARHGAGTGLPFLASCLTAAGSASTVASIDNALAVLETAALIYVGHRLNDGWSWGQIADAIEAQIARDAIEGFNYAVLPIPANYLTVWGDPW